MGDGGDRLWEILERWLQAESVELDDLAVHGEGAGRVVRVTVDAEGGIGVGRISELSAGVGRLLDESGFGGSYTLEVTSPGLERALSRPSHYKKSLGREVVVKTRSPVAGAQSHRGVLSAFGPDSVAVTVDGADRHIPLGEVTQARTVFTWEKSPKPGKGGGQ